MNLFDSIVCLIMLLGVIVALIEIVIEVIIKFALCTLLLVGESVENSQAFFISIHRFDIAIQLIIGSS